MRPKSNIKELYLYHEASSVRPHLNRSIEQQLLLISTPDYVAGAVESVEAALPKGCWFGRLGSRWVSQIGLLLAQHVLLRVWAFFVMVVCGSARICVGSWAFVFCRNVNRAL